MSRFILIFLGLLGAILFVHWLLREDPKKIARSLKWGLLWVAIIVIILLALTGRLHWLFAIFAALIPFVQRLLALLRFFPILSQLYTYIQNAKAARASRGPTGSKNTGQTSRVRSKFLDMTLDHDSGQIQGEIIAGKHAGQQVDQLSIKELLELLIYYRSADMDSAALLQAYLDRHHEGWQEFDTSGDTTPPMGSNGPMTEDEARQILGVDQDASEEDIVNAHRRLMQKLHPDRGGSDYLAAKVNKAKDVLLNS